MSDVAIPRAVQPAVPETLPVIRSGELFTQYDTDARREYFRAVAATPAESVAPEAVFGTNGWPRRVAEAGVSPEQAKAAFDYAWDSMDPAERERVAYSEAADRYFMSGVEQNAAYAEQKSAFGYANAMTGGRGSQEAAMAMAEDPQAATAALAEALFGRNPTRL